MLVIRAELQPRERLLRSPCLFTLSIMLTSAALGSGYPELRILLHITYTNRLPLLQEDVASKKDEELS